ncbi:MAG: nuclear transport factor 2 family protein [Bryobacteraceae bacterium]
MALHQASMTKVLADLAGADSQSSLAVVQNVYAALATGSVDAMGEYLADDVELELHDSSGMMSGNWKGRDTVLAAITANFAKVDQQKPQIKGMTADGNTVAVLMSETGVVKESRRAYTANGVQWFTIAAGRLQRIEEIIILEF